jgi:hypothetical protein
MHDSVRKFVSDAFAILKTTRCPTQTILEIGSFDVNGHIRDLLPADAAYLGLDLRAGPGVDWARNPADMLPTPYQAGVHLAETGHQDRAARFAEVRDNEQWDVILCLETIEHDVNPASTLTEASMAGHARSTLILTTRSPGFPLHDHPADHWRWSPDAIEVLLASTPWRLVVVDTDPEQPGVFVLAARVGGP